MDGLGPSDCIRVGLSMASLCGGSQAIPKNRIEAVSIRPQAVDLALSPLAICQHDRLISPPRDRDKIKEEPGRTRARAEPARDDLLPGQAPGPEPEPAL